MKNIPVWRRVEDGALSACKKCKVQGGKKNEPSLADRGRLRAHVQWG